MATVEGGAPSMSAPAIGGFWRRLAAFALDSVILSVPAIVVGFALFDFFASFGQAGRLLGAVIVLAYCGALNSRIGGGQTVGKRLLGLRVVNRLGEPIGFARACLRTTILGLPWFLNGLYLKTAFDPEMQIPFDQTVVLVLLGLVVFGGGGAIVYLFIFNRATRQSLHDLAVGTFVIRASSPAGAITSSIWRIHLAIVGCLSVLVVLAGVSADYWGQRLLGDNLRPLLAIQRSLLALPDVRSASVTLVYDLGQREERPRLAASVVLAERPAIWESVATKYAAVVLREDPDAKLAPKIIIELVYGFDLGIASGTRKVSGNFTPSEWQTKIDSL
jgi:uncharacterized RDD family membrane protein YckC